MMETDKRSHEVCTSIRKFIEEQTDIRKIVEELARRIDAMRDGTHPRSEDTRDGTHPRDASSGSNASNEQNIPDVGVAMQLQIEDLKTKAARLTEQLTNQIGLLAPLKERVDLTENQIIKWRYRRPELTDDEDDQTVVIAVEVQEQLDSFREFHEIRLETNSLEEKIGILERACSES